MGARARGRASGKLFGMRVMLVKQGASAHEALATTIGVAQRAAVKIEVSYVNGATLNADGGWLALGAPDATPG
jgi:hypothetical protein